MRRYNLSSLHTFVACNFFGGWAINDSNCVILRCIKVILRSIKLIGAYAGRLLKRQKQQCSIYWRQWYLYPRRRHQNTQNQDALWPNTNKIMLELQWFSRLDHLQFTFLYTLLIAAGSFDFFKQYTDVVFSKFVHVIRHSYLENTTSVGCQLHPIRQRFVKDINEQDTDPFAYSLSPHIWAPPPQCCLYFY